MKRVTLTLARDLVGVVAEQLGVDLWVLLPAVAHQDELAPREGRHQRLSTRALRPGLGLGSAMSRVLG